MSLIFCDSFDHYDTSRGIYKYDSGTPPVAAVGRRGTQGLSITTNTSGLVRNIGAQTEVIVMQAFYLTYTDYQSVGNKHNGFPFDNSATSRAFLLGLGYQGISQMGIAVASDGSLHVLRGAAIDLNANSLACQLVASSAAGVVRFNQWVHIAMKVTATSCVVRVNNVQVINYSGSTIQNGMPSSFTQFLTHGGSFGEYAAVGSGWAGRVDDLVILNTSGSTNNDFLGDVRVDYCKPDGPGNSSQSVIIGTNPAATRWQSVDDQTPDDAITGVEFAAEGEKDLYTHEDLPYPDAAVYGVQGVIYARKQDAGLSALKHIQRVNALDNEASLTHYPAGGDYAYYLTPFDTSADGNWTLTKFNDSEFGMKREAV